MSRRAMNPTYGVKHLSGLALLLLFLWNNTVHAEDIWVVARLDAPVASLSQAEVAELFLGGNHASPLTPFDQTDATLRGRFYRAVAGMAPQSVRAYWARRVFTGRGRPAPMLTLEIVEHVLADNPRAVTYLPAGWRPENAKVLLNLSTGEKE